MGDNVITADARLVLLRAMKECGGRSNESVLQDCVNLYNHSVSRDWIRTQLAWLAEQALVTVTDLNGLTLAALTHRGYDLVDGLITVPGIKRARRT